MSLEYSLCPQTQGTVSVHRVQFMFRVQMTTVSDCSVLRVQLVYSPKCSL